MWKKDEGVGKMNVYMVGEAMLLTIQIIRYDLEVKYEGFLSSLFKMAKTKIYAV